MNLKQTLTVSAFAFALAAVALVFPGVSHADDCGSSTRVALPECVSMGYGNNNRDVAVINNCAYRMKVKVDRQGCVDWTWTMDGGGDRRDAAGGCNIKNVKCCGSSSVGGCYQTWESLCKKEWNSSSASASCSNASFGYYSSGPVCSIEADCLNQHNIPVSASAWQHLANVQYLNNCRGTLTRNSC